MKPKDALNDEDSNESDDDGERRYVKRNIAEEIAYENPEIPSYTELAWNLVQQPVVMYAGFGRVVITTERRKTFVQVAQGQELALHSVPILLLVYYNNSLL